MMDELFYAALLRVLLLVYGAWHDQHLEVKYTDIDYSVFSDGAELVWQGRSPFERPTYRYTPLLALLLTPNTFAHPAWGKLLFATADLAVGVQLHAILLERRVPRAVARGCMCMWLFNPLSLNVSTRGNAESVVALLLLSSLHALLRRRAAAAGALLAAAMHLKPYPVIYLPAFLVCFDADYAADSATPLEDAPVQSQPLGATLMSAVWRWWSGGGGSTGRAVWRARLSFGAALVSVYTALFVLCFVWCGDAFWREALLHHLTRQDIRHNFSPYFYPLYLVGPGALRRLISTLAFVPQAALLLALAARFGRDLPFCMFAQTLVFVTFNKVCTAQYFIWYHALLPLILPSSAALLKSERPRTALVVATWVVTLLGWLALAHQLEFRSRNVFTSLWLASLAFFGANVVVVREAIRMHHATPLFRGGRLARQACLYGAEAEDGASAASLLREGFRRLDGSRPSEREGRES